MSEIIREITGIGATNNVNYIPIVHYCVCNSGTNKEIQEARWIGKSDEPYEVTVSPGKFKYYEGMTVAVLFTDGFNLEDYQPQNEGDPLITEYKLRIHGLGNAYAKPMRLYGDSVLDCVMPNTVVVFSYYDEAFRVFNGITGAKFDALVSEINEIVDGLSSKVVLRGGYDNTASSTGSSSNPIYINDGQVVASNETVGTNKRPVYLDSGTITPISANIGSNTRPIYINEYGEFTPIDSVNSVYYINAITSNVGALANTTIALEDSANDTFIALHEKAAPGSNPLNGQNLAIRLYTLRDSQDSSIIDRSTYTLYELQSISMSELVFTHISNYSNNETFVDTIIINSSDNIIQYSHMINRYLQPSVSMNTLLFDYV